MAQENDKGSFGFPDLWSQIRQDHSSLFTAIEQLDQLGDKAVASAEKKAPESPPPVVLMLCQATLLSLKELEILAGNGCGPGALKIARGMFESALFARYLAQHPKEISDYIEYLHILLWGHLRGMQKWLQKLSPKEASDRASFIIVGIDPKVREEMEAEIAANPGRDYTKEVEDRYNEAKVRFSRSGGRARSFALRALLKMFLWWRSEGRGAQVRSRWHRKSIAKMAKKLGWSEMYGLMYNQAASIHHANVYGLIAQLYATPGGPTIDSSVPGVWVRQALVFGFWCAIQALDTLNRHYALGIDGSIRHAYVALGNACTELARKNVRAAAGAE